MFVVTRPTEESDALVAELRASGVVARALPAVVREPAPWPEHWGRCASRTNVVFLTSPYCAALAVPHLHDIPRLRVAALAPATAAVVERAGFRVDVRAAGGAVALAGAVVDWLASCAPDDRAARVLYPTSDRATAEGEHERAVRILDAAAPVDVAVAYRTRTADDLAGRVRQLSADQPLHNAIALLYSPSAARALVDAGAVAWGAVWCVGASTERAWRSAAGARAGVVLRIEAADVVARAAALPLAPRAGAPADHRRGEPP